nr:P-loop NTPase fold protein [Leptolyngbya sp. FACHB-321]
MQQVRQDLAALSDRLTDSSHNHRELEKCFPRGPARVILYIDDLDRCPPKRVVEVLEAVQLLLNTKLFIVVLGIDDRYIARALEQVYQGVLKRGGKPSGIDYLEKIIQIPYRMRPLSPATVDGYLRSQLKLGRSAPTAHAQQPQQSSATLNGSLQPLLVDADSDGHGKSQERTAPAIAQTDSLESPASSDPSLAPNQTIQQIVESIPLESQSENSEVQQFERISDEIIPVERSPDLTNSSQVPTTQTTAVPLPPHPSATNSATYLETIAEITEFDETEFKLLVDCCRHVDITPRTAKRLINIYKILQIIWSTRSQKTPPQPPPTDQDKRVVMSFLALSGRHPSLMRNLFEEIDFQLEENASDGAYKLNFDELLKAIHPQSATDDFHAQREWRRFEGDIKRMLIDPQPTDDQITELSIDRPTFDLMLSFCFVGDIGYDPDDYQSNPQPNSVSKNQESLLL